MGQKNIKAKTISLVYYRAVRFVLNLLEPRAGYSHSCINIVTS